MEIDAWTKNIRVTVAPIVGHKENLTPVLHHRRDPINEVACTRQFALAEFGQTEVERAGHRVPNCGWSFEKERGDQSHGPLPAVGERGGEHRRGFGDEQQALAVVDQKSADPFYDEVVVRPSGMAQAHVRWPPEQGKSYLLD